LISENTWGHYLPWKPKCENQVLMGAWSLHFGDLWNNISRLPMHATLLAKISLDNESEGENKESWGV
jgi:hypothetical protein